VQVKKVIFYSLSLAALLSCKKEVEKKVVGSTEPVFWLVSDDPFSSGDSSVITAGDRGFYMETSYGNDTLGLATYSGKLTNITGSTQESFEFIFRAHSSAFSRSFPDINEQISLGSIPIFDNSTVLVDQSSSYFMMEPQHQSNEDAYSWSFSTSSSIKTGAYQELLIDTTEPIDFVVNLTSINANCATTTTKVLHDLKYPCFDGFTVSYDPLAKSITATSTSSAEPIWSVNKASFGENKEITVPVDSPGTYVLTSFFDEPYCKNTTIKEVQIWDIDEAVVCENDIVLSQRPNILVDPNKEGSVEIIYTDKFGDVYWSSHSENPGTFIITAIEDYIDNVNGDRTKKIHFEGTFCVTNQLGLKKYFNNMKGVIAVAYPH
jgi:hypothetical protein